MQIKQKKKKKHLKKIRKGIGKVKGLFLFLFFFLLLSFYFYMQPVVVAPNWLCFISLGTSVFLQLFGFCRRWRRRVLRRSWDAATLCVTLFVVMKFQRKKKKILFLLRIRCAFYNNSTVSNCGSERSPWAAFGDGGTLSRWTCPVPTTTKITFADDRSYCSASQKIRSGENAQKS